MTREEALNEIKSWDFLEGKEIEAIHTLIPELRKSEDERIRKSLVQTLQLAKRNDGKLVISNTLADKYLAYLEKQEIFSKNGAGCYYYDADGSYTFIGSLGFGPIKDIKINGERPKTENKSVSVDLPGACPCVEKHKEPENTSASTMAPSCWEVEQKEQKPKAKAKSPLSPHELYDAKIEGIGQGRQDVLDHPEQFGLQKPAEWSEEDADMLNCCISSVEEAKENRYAYNETDGNTSYDREIDWLKSLRPSWKPSEGQIEALEAATVRYQSTGLESLYEDLKKL